jgi:biopolymer transport protein ExbB
MTRVFSMITRVTAVLALSAVPAFAQEAKATSLLDTIFQGAGGIGWVIIALSVLGLALIVEHAINITRLKMAPPEVVENLESMLDNQDVQGAYDYCEQNPGYLTNVMAAALPKLSHGYDSMSQAAMDVNEEEAIKLHAKISWLSLLGNIAPLLGLLGTVAGMLDAFGVIETQTNPSPADLAGGIKLALVTTMLGLVVAVPVMVGFFYFRNKVVRIVLEITAIIEDLLDRFRPQTS